VGFQETRFGEAAPLQVEPYSDLRQLALHIAALQKGASSGSSTSWGEKKGSIYQRR